MSAHGGSLSSTTTGGNGGTANANGGNNATAIAVQSVEGRSGPCCGKGSSSGDVTQRDNSANAGNGGEANANGGDAYSKNVVLASGNAIAFGGDARGGSLSSTTTGGNGGTANANGGNNARALAVQKAERDGCCPPPCKPRPCRPKPCPPRPCAPPPPPPCDGGVA